jgi:hypothetical protein
VLTTLGYAALSIERRARIFGELPRFGETPSKSDMATEIAAKILEGIKHHKE